MPQSIFSAKSKKCIFLEKFQDRYSVFKNGGFVDNSLLINGSVDIDSASKLMSYSNSYKLSNSIRISADVNFKNVLSDIQPIVSFGDFMTTSFEIGLEATPTGSTKRIYFKDPSATIYSTEYLPTGRNKIDVVVSGTKVYFYVNDELFGTSVTHTFTFVSVDWQTLLVGGDQSYMYYFDGDIYSVGLYDKYFTEQELSDAPLTYLKNSTVILATNSVIGNSDPFVTPDSANYEYDAILGDGLGNNKPTKIVNDLGFDYSVGTTPYLAIYDIDDQELSTNFTVGLWVNWNSSVNAHFMGTSSLSSPWNGFCLRFQNVYLEMEIGGGGTWRSANDVVSKNNNAYELIIATMTPTALRIYRDGDQIGANGSSMPNISNDQPLYIGKLITARSGANFAGQHGPVFVDSKRAWTPTEIKDLYLKGMNYFKTYA